MAQHNGYQGSGWARTRGVCAALLAVFLTAGCAAKPTPNIGPWAYEFTVASFADQRPNDDTRMMAVVPFSLDSFMKGWQNNVQRSLFQNSPAKLDIVLRSYEATASGSSYALSMDVSLRGRDFADRTLVATNATCSVALRIDATQWGDFGQQSIRQGSAVPLTEASRNATMWQKVMDACVKDIALEFGNSLPGGAR